MSGGFFLRHCAPRVLFLHHHGAGDAAVNDHLAAMNGGAVGQREGVGDIERFARVLLEDLVHLDRDKFAGDAEAGLDVDERQGDAGRGELGNEAEDGLFHGWEGGEGFKRRWNRGCAGWR